MSTGDSVPEPTDSLTPSTFHKQEVTVYPAAGPFPLHPDPGAHTYFDILAVDVKSYRYLR